MSVMKKYEAIPQLDSFYNVGECICMWKLTFQIYKYFLLKSPSTKITLPSEIMMLLGIGQVTSLRIHFLGFVQTK